MDGIALEYRDPLFGVIVFFLIIFIISFLTYSFSIYQERKARKEYRRLHKRFELGKLKEEDYVHLYKTYNLPFDSILLLASSFSHKGDYNKSISIYLALLEHVKEKVKKEEVLELLGTTYFKGGFLQRSQEVFKRILKFSARNKKALTHMLLIYEKLKDFNKAKEVANCLEELNKNMITDKLYIETQIIINDPLLSFEKKADTLYGMYEKNPQTQRVVAEYLLIYNKDLFWRNLNKFDGKKIIDLLWYLNFDDVDFNQIHKNSFVEEIFNAKGFLDTKQHSDDFNIDILISLAKHEHQTNATLDFEYTCSSCKKTHPIYEARCPHCHNVFTFNTNFTLTKGFNEANQSLQ